MGCQGLQDWWRLLEFSPKSPTEGGHTQHIRERFLPPFSLGFWDRVSSFLIVGLCAHKRPECRPSARLGQVKANTASISNSVCLHMPIDQSICWPMENRCHGSNCLEHEHISKALITISPYTMPLRMFAQE
jgi:hypothetical protein